MAEHEKKDPCAGLEGIERINCMEKQAIGHTVSTAPAKPAATPTPPARVTATPPARGVSTEEDEEQRRRERVRKFLGK